MFEDPETARVVYSAVMEQSVVYLRDYRLEKGMMELGLNKKGKKAASGQ
jgi:hypothetical protein